ncbi:uncharacterized protein LOC132722119 [Ruditapes philippinarum]|uniref:uncharacterized protein LOC132722119 n=1 Tax=Ruditapes philippinarum TaxID=129788 RepID=UPI00295C0DA0|nr:uncharacterized protein LOC132722119 [Ruditapes philippinarum]
MEHGCFYIKLFVFITTFAVILQDFQADCRGGGRGGGRGGRYRGGGAGGSSGSSGSGDGTWWIVLAVIGGVFVLIGLLVVIIYCHKKR